ncbi:hypothetical protein T492DRAFT_591874, partial [Pavlovales sp. CCMP2436]
AADMGHAGAAHALAQSYAHGSGVTRNQAEAKRLWEQAANSGLVDAQFMLEFAYAYGNGHVSQDLGEALRLWKLAAAQGHEGAKTKLWHALHAARVGLKSCSHSLPDPANRVSA